MIRADVNETSGKETLDGAPGTENKKKNQLVVELTLHVNNLTILECSYANCRFTWFSVAQPSVRKHLDVISNEFFQFR